MALFAGKLHAQIAELERALHETVQGSTDAIAELRDSHAHALQEAREAQERELAVLNTSYDETRAREHQEHQIALAHLQGQIDALKEKGAKYDAIVQGHAFHKGGSVMLENRKYDLWEAHTDVVGANMRVLVPEGTAFP